MLVNTGKHLLVFTSWNQWQKNSDFEVAKKSLPKSYQLLENQIAMLNELSGGKARLPWMDRRGG